MLRERPRGAESRNVKQRRCRPQLRFHRRHLLPSSWWMCLNCHCEGMSVTRRTKSSCTETPHAIDRIQARPWGHGERKTMNMSSLSSCVIGAGGGHVLATCSLVQAATHALYFGASTTNLFFGGEHRVRLPTHLWHSEDGVWSADVQTASMNAYTSGPSKAPCDPRG